VRIFSLTDTLTSGFRIHYTPPRGSLAAKIFHVTMAIHHYNPLGKKNQGFFLHTFIKKENIFLLQR